MKKRPRLVVGVVIKHDNRYLLIKEKLESGRDYWIIPGGGVDFGESLEEAAVREMQEELGLSITITKFLGFKEAVFPQYNYHSVIFFYLASGGDNHLHLEDKIIQAKYFSLEQIEKLELVESARWVFETLNKEL